MFFQNEIKDSKIEVRLSSKNKYNLNILAKNEGLKMSQFVLKCIDFYVKNSNKTN